jgi:hypothetical protein
VKPQGPKTKRTQVRASLTNAWSELTSKPGFGDKVARFSILFALQAQLCYNNGWMCFTIYTPSPFKEGGYILKVSLSYRLFW